ncbi:MAG: GntR family transcriptional regulator, partial [Anaerolineales bacterium]
SVQLPTEPALSRAMHVSRSTLRAALDSLAREGVVVRKRGVGTFVSEQPLAANNLNLNWGVTEVIRATGATPVTTDLLLRTAAADERLAARLEVPPETALIIVERVRLADARRVVFSRDFFPLALLGAAPALPALEAYLLREHSLYGYLKSRLDLDFHHAVAWLRPVTADADLAGRLQIETGSGLLYIEQVDFGADGVPLVLADEFHVAEAFTFTVYRSRLPPGAAASERDN